MLGRRPEMCEPWSHITAAYDKGFLILEVNKIIFNNIIRRELDLLCRHQIFYFSSGC